MQYFNLHTFFFSIMSLSAYLHHDIELRDVATKTDDVMWCDVWGGEGRLPLHLQIPKNTLAGRSEKLHWQTCDPLLSPSISRLLATEDHAQNLEEQLWTGVHQLMGSCFEWRGGREGVLYLTDVRIVAIWSEKGQFFVGVSQHFCIWLKLSLTTLPKLNLETSIPVRPSGWYFIFFTASKSWKPST